MRLSSEQHLLKIIWTLSTTANTFSRRTLTLWAYLSLTIKAISILLNWISFNIGRDTFSQERSSTWSNTRIISNLSNRKWLSVKFVAIFWETISVVQQEILEICSSKTLSLFPFPILHMIGLQRQQMSAKLILGPLPKSTRRKEKVANRTKKEPKRLDLQTLKNLQEELLKTLVTLFWTRCQDSGSKSFSST